MYDVQWNLRGFDAAIEKMRSLPVELRGKPARSALGSAARVIANQAKSNAMGVDDPETGRKIAQNIAQRFRSRYQKRTGDLMISVGIATPKGRIPKGNPDEGAKGPTPHWHLIEHGTAKARAQPFLRKALAEKVDEAQRVFADRLEQQIDRLLAKGR